MNLTANTESDSIGPTVRALRQLSPGSQCAGAELTNEWGGEPEKGFQLTKQEDRFALEIDSPAEDDRVIRHEGAIALMVDQGTEEKKWAPYLLTWRIGPAGLS